MKRITARRAVNRPWHVGPYTGGLVLACLLASGPAARGAHFTTGTDTAARFGVHEIVLTGDGSVANPLDTVVTVTFTPPSGEKNAKTVWAYFDGGSLWRARVYVSEAGEWTWTSACASDERLDGKRGKFAARDSELRGRLLPHPRNARQWITEDGRWFLNVSDTAYFLLCAQDGNGDPVSTEDARQYIREDVERGITSIRCFLASRRGGFTESSEQWKEWYFADGTFDRLRLDNLKCADGRLRMLLDEFPDVAVQLILFPLEAYGRDDRFWTALSPVQRERLLRQLVARLAAYPQLFWLITNDAHYGDKFPNSNAMVREVGAYLQQHDPWQHPRSTGHARRLPFFFGGEDWATYIHIEHAHDLGALQYGLYDSYAKPVFLGEDRYEQDHGPSLDPAHMRSWQRRLFWAWLLSSGSANYGGRWWAVHPYTTTATRTATYHGRPNYTFHTALNGLDSVRFIRDYFEQREIDLGQFAPDHALVEDADGRKAAQAPRLMRRGNDEFLIYHPHVAADEQAADVAGSTKARLWLDLETVPGTFAVEWYRAEDGRSQAGGDVSGGERLELTAPWTGADVVVRLLRKGGF
ncbi:MAG: DUF5060 domain-containing protein [Thermoguttaceae bacterium]